jgi:dipeptidyl-peptidase-4
MSPIRTVCCLLLAGLAAAMNSVAAEELTIARLFQAPALAGPALTGVKISPDGLHVTYLKGNSADNNRLDLWEYDVHTRRAQVLIDAHSLAAPGKTPSDEELARRERQRTAALSGILEYAVAPSGRSLIFTLDGTVYLYDLTRPQAHRIARISPPSAQVTDATVSPRGRFIGYVRDQNLYAYDVVAGHEVALTEDGGGTIKNGMAEFVAQEEMDRSTGYWWAPDDRRVAFARVDESPVPLVERFEISADNVKTYAQRYPAAGNPNVSLRLGVKNLASGALTWIDLGADPDVYLARVDWLPDGRTLAVQRESRDQHRLDLLFADVESGATRLVLSETSPTWIELNHELTFLEHSPEFIWASSRDGFEHLYLYDYSGKLLRRLTQGAWNVDDLRSRAIKSVDERRRLVYFTANERSPICRDLYVTSLDTADPAAVRRLSNPGGLHAITMAPRADFYVDEFSSSTQPLQVALHRPDGSTEGFLLENRLDETHPDAPYRADNATPQFGTLMAADGQNLQYRLFKPRGFDPTKRYPAIVDVYGGPGVQRVLDDWTGSSFTQILTRAGYVVFQLDNRGSGFRGRDFSAPIYQKLGEVEVADQVAGTRWLAAQSFVDPARIGVWGWSYGGYLTLMLMFKAPDLYRAGVSGAPVTDWSLYDTHYTERYLGKPQDNGAGYEASSVLPYAKDLQGSLLVIHGMADDNVLFMHSTKLFRRLQDLGKPFEVMVYPGAKHGLTRQHDGRHAYATILRFFDDKLRSPAALPPADSAALTQPR